MPIATEFAGHTVHEIPPNGQGIAALMALGILRHHDLAALPVDSVAAQHLQIEAMKLAFADAYRWVADAARDDAGEAADLLDDGYLAERARRIDPKRAQDFAHGTPPRGGTIYLAAADASGMMVSLIQSNYMGFGSGVVVPGTGVSLQNRGHCFTLEAGHPNVVEPGKRPFHTIIPGFLTKDGRPQMSFGVMGGNMQPQGHCRRSVRMLVYGQQPQAACDAPRWKVATGRQHRLRGHDARQRSSTDCARSATMSRRSTRATISAPGQFIWQLIRRSPRTATLRPATRVAKGRPWATDALFRRESRRRRLYCSGIGPSVSNDRNAAVSTGGHTGAGWLGLVGDGS